MANNEQHAAGCAGLLHQWTKRPNENVPCALCHRKIRNRHRAERRVIEILEEEGLVANPYDPKGLEFIQAMARLDWENQ